MSKEKYYENDNFTLLHGDALLLLKKIDDKSIDMIFADPPYFLSGDGRFILTILSLWLVYSLIVCQKNLKN